MSKVLLIIQREYFTRVRNKTFILLTLFAPVLYGLLIALPILASRFIGQDARVIDVVDESNKIAYHLPDNGDVIFQYSKESFESLKSKMHDKEGPQLILHIPKDLNIFKPDGINLLARKNVSVGVSSHIEGLLSDRIRQLKIETLKLDANLVDSLETSVAINIRENTLSGEKERSSAAASGASAAGGILIYMFIFLYGGLVLRGVQEEKQNRIVEIIVSSIKPFQLMMGKILGIALVGLTQFVVWILLTLVVVTAIGAAFAPSPEEIMATQKFAMNGAAQMQNAGGFDKITSALGTLNLPFILGMFMFYFLGGYLLYSSMFAAVAAAVDSQSDLYQFMFPISLPIVFSISMIGYIMENPDSNFTFWLSIIPFTSPVVMMARLPFDVPTSHLLLSGVLLILGFIATTWMAGKIYRTGILMYGKKITYKELVKWLFY